MDFVLIFITSPSQGKLGRTAALEFVDTRLADLDPVLSKENMIAP